MEVIYLTLEELFCREFNQMMLQRKANTGLFNLSALDLPEGVFGEICTRDKVIIKNIEEEYYSLLNNSGALLWSHGKLSKRKFDYRGEFIKKDGKYVVEPVTLPHESVAVISDVKIGVPTKFKSKESFDYVDVLHRKNKDGSVDVRYVYIVPREYCYKLNQTALVLSLNKLRVYYYGSSVCLQNGYVLYMYIIPYKATSTRNTNYRVLDTGTDLDEYQTKIDSLIQYWYSRGYLFNYEACQLYEGVKGRTNIAYETLPVIKDSYQRYDEEKSMASVDDTQNLWEENMEDSILGKE